MKFKVVFADAQKAMRFVEVTPYIIHPYSQNLLGAKVQSSGAKVQFSGKTGEIFRVYEVIDRKDVQRVDVRWDDKTVSVDVPLPDLEAIR